MNRETLVSILATVLFITVLAIIGCGALDDNSQPTIEPITDQTLDVEDKTTVKVNITDADVDDTHIINAASDNVLVAAVVEDVSHETSVTLIGVGPGIATITVTATDDSGQDNAEAIPVTFKVTVNEPPPPPIDKGPCFVGMTLQPGESCTYLADQAPVIFSVKRDGNACRESEVSIFREVFGIDVQIHNPNICVDYDIERDDFFGTRFAANKNPNGSWTIDEVPYTLCQIPPLDKDFRGTPVLFRHSNNTCLLLSDGNFVTFVCSGVEFPFPIVVGGPIQTPTKALVEFSGGDFINRVGARIPDGELTEFEVSNTFKGGIELRNNRSIFVVNVSKQSGVTIKGFNQLTDIHMIGTLRADCLSGLDNAIVIELTGLVKDMLDIIRDNQ